MHPFFLDLEKMEANFMENFFISYKISVTVQ